MPVRCVVLDFDGTFTDVDREAAPFLVEYRSFLDGLVGSDTRPEWDRHLAELLSHPDNYGWQYDGKIVAPGHVDPYVRASTITQMVFDERGLLRRPDHRAAIVEALYTRAYAHSATVFKPEAREVLDALVARNLPVFVVTNATPRVVKAKLDDLKLRHRDQLEVFGDAKKYVICGLAEPDTLFDGLPETMELPGLNSRRIYLRRGMYYQVLRSIWTRLSIAPAEILVAGDIWELDLSLPAALGCSVQLVCRAGVTPSYEIQQVRSLGTRGGVSEDLHAILGRLD